MRLAFASLKASSCWLAVRRANPVIFRCVTLLCLLSVAGCSTLIKGPYDTPSQRSAKTWKRAALGVGTLGISEIWVNRRAKQYGRHWTYWFDRLSLASVVENAHTHEQLTLAFGGVPACSSEGDGRLCQWTADSRAYSVLTSGFHLYSSSIYESQLVQSGGEFYRLICSLPQDASERDPGSCTHLINGIRFSETEFRNCFGRWESFCPQFEDVKAGTASRQWQYSEFVRRGRTQ
jgi:hypothetical protein